MAWRLAEEASSAIRPHQVYRPHEVSTTVCRADVQENKNTYFCIPGSVTDFIGRMVIYWLHRLIGGDLPRDRDDNSQVFTTAV